MLHLGTYEVLPTRKETDFTFGTYKYWYFQVASTWADSFDILLDAYERLGENIPIFSDYKVIFESNTKFQDVLAVVYEDILEFHQTALRFFKRPGKYTSTNHFSLQIVWQ